MPVGTLSSYSLLRCPVHFLTGLDCPTCGLGRSLVRAWSGDFAAAFDYHPLGPALLAAALALWGREAFTRLRDSARAGTQ